MITITTNKYETMTTKEFEYMEFLSSKFPKKEITKVKLSTIIYDDKSRMPAFYNFYYEFGGHFSSTIFIPKVEADGYLRDNKINDLLNEN